MQEFGPIKKDEAAKAPSILGCIKYCMSLKKEEVRER